MIDDSAERAPIGRIDVSGLPGPDPRPDPDWSTVRKVSESGGFIDRSPRATRRHLTGRNHQFNAKATADTIKRFTDCVEVRDRRRFRARRLKGVGRLIGEDASSSRIKAKQEAIHGNVSLRAQEKALRLIAVG